MEGRGWVPHFLTLSWELQGSRCSVGGTCRKFSLDLGARVSALGQSRRGMWPWVGWCATKLGFGDFGFRGLKVKLLALRTVAKMLLLPGPKARRRTRRSGGQGPS